MQWSNHEQQKELAQWWSTRHPQIPLKYADLDQQQKVLLTAWYAVASAEIPSLTEALPLEYSAALSELTVSAGRYHPHARRFLRQRFTLDMIPNRRRIVRARKPIGLG